MQGADYRASDWGQPAPHIAMGGDAVYLYQGYAIDDGTIMRDGNIEILDIAGDHDVYFIYKKKSTTVSIKYPVNMSFSALYADDGDITSPVYAFENGSDFPVQVRYGGLTVIEDAGLAFVDQAQGAGQVALTLELPSAYAGSNGLTNGVRAMAAGTSSDQLIGTLADSASGGISTGYFTIGGRYGGNFPLDAKYPKVQLIFHFELATN